MRAIAAAWVVLGLVGASACGGDGNQSSPGTAAECAGSYTGSFSGSESGTLSGTLTSDGAFDVTFSGSAGSLSGSGTLGSNGQVSMQIGGNVIAGRLDSTCRAAGTWSYSGGTGTWQMQRVSR